MGPAPSPSRQKFPELDALIGKTLGGCRIEERLGAGGMGAVFLAHQLSLDRKVAVKVLPAQLSANSELLARFTREALSAAQLSHHNIVHVYDVGNEGDTYFISMEYVKGDNLGAMVRRDGRLRVDDAAGYILQAARGLHHAHQRGIIHRDIKPDNLMVNEHGVVKVADLGLAKMGGAGETPGGRPHSADPQAPMRQAASDLTQAQVSMGTPAYMSPEQARDAANVDSRADQYSLGCTLYYLCAGCAPYQGTTVFELISKHMSEPLTPLDVHVRGVPAAFSRIVRRMLEKDPAKRYPDLGHVIRDFEDYLGIGVEEGAYRPRESHLTILELQQRAFYSVPALKRRKMALTLQFALLPLLLAASVASRSFALAGAAIGFWFLSLLFSFALDGIRNKSYLFRRVRSAAFGMSWKSWLGAAGGTAAALGLLYLFGWLPYWVGCAVAAAAAALAYQALIVRPLRAQRADQIWKMQEMLKELRVRGVSEDALQEFVARFSGEHWEEFFESLFGYKDMIAARASVAGMERVKQRKRFATWRDPVVRWLDGVEDARKQAREKNQLTRVEANRLKARGLSEDEARQQAEQEATRILAEVIVRPVAEEKVRKAKARHTRRLQAATLKRLFSVSRAVFGLAILASTGALYAGNVGLSIPPVLSGFLRSYWTWGHGGTVVGLAAGALLFLSAFSCRALLSALVFLGALLMIFLHPIVQMVGQPQFNDQTGLITGLALVGVGFGVNLLQKLMGGRF